MKIVIGFDERVIGTIAVGEDGKFVFEGRAEHDAATLRQVAETYAQQLIDDDSTTEENVDDLTAGDALALALDKMESKRFWAEPGDDEAAEACGRDVWEEE